MAHGLSSYNCLLPLLRMNGEPHDHVRWLRTTWNSSFSGSDISGPSGTCTHIHEHIILKNGLTNIYKIPKQLIALFLKRHYFVLCKKGCVFHLLAYH